MNEIQILPGGSNLYPHKKSSGFTLVELTIVIVLLGVLAGTVVPKFISRDEFTDRTISDEFVARLRLVQTMNMNEPQTVCSKLRVEPATNNSGVGSAFGHVTVLRSDCDTPATLDESKSRQRVVRSETPILLNGMTALELRFDTKGRPTGTNCLSGCSVTIGTKTIKVESEGYIHAL